MADWLLIVPKSPIPVEVPHREALARALRARGASAVLRTDVAGAVFMTVAESADDPGVVTIAPDSSAQCSVVASALLTEREDVLRALRTEGGRNIALGSDGDLLAHAAAHWGEQTWTRLGGEFAVAAWHPTQRTLLLARDSEGARPIFWTNTGSHFVASTRFETMMVTPSVSRAPDHAALLSYMCLQRDVPESGRTWLAHVEEMPPGHALRWRDGIVATHRWWTFPSDVSIQRRASERDTIDQFRATLQQSVRERLRGHRRVAIALSGGMDSSAVAAAAAALRDQGSVSVEFNATHAEYPPELRSSEAALAVQVAQALRITSVRIPIGDVPAWPLSDSMRARPPHHWFGQWEPFARTLADQGTAILMGTSGEIFSLASLGDAIELRRPQDLLAAWIAARRSGLPLQPWRRSQWARRRTRPFSGVVLPVPAWLAPAALATHGIADIRQAMLDWRPENTPLRLVPFHAMLVLLRQSSHLFDHGASRVPALNPFADRRVVRLAMGLNPVPWRMQKYLVRRSLTGILPPAILRRPRESTPWLTRPLFNSDAPRALAKTPLHPALAELLVEGQWRARASQITTFLEGHAWLSVLAVSSWLGELDHAR